ncbi:MAG: dihydroorotase [Clostridia bacterium]|nr:dihydroorotase [Clostridia bacterium]
MSVLIKNGQVINPATGLNAVMDLYIEDNKVVEINASITKDADEVIDANGKIVVPGFVDLHVHLREPGFEQKETIETGTLAAVAGGVTTVACMPNTNPAIHSKEVVKLIQEKAKLSGKAKVEVVGAITIDILGNKISPIEELLESGIIGLSDDGRTTPDESIMKKAFEYLKSKDLPLMAHTEDMTLARGGCMNEGERSKALGLKGIPNAAESNIVKRDIELCKEMDSRLHICHVSAAESMDHIIEAKKEGVKVTVEICPHHFILTDDIVNADDAYSKVNPPLRSKKDVEKMIEAIKAGHIDCIVTDHAPHEEKTKKVGYPQAAFGISGIETSFALSYTYLVENNHISLMKLIEMMSYNPAQIIKKSVGNINEGEIADIAIIDLNASYTIDSNKFYSKGKNTPFNGYEVKGVVTHTLVDGKVVYRR